MKKSHKLIIAATFTLALVIVGTVVMSGATGESKVEDRVVNEITEGFTGVESYNIGSSLTDFTMDEIMAMYPGYLEYLKAFQAQTVNIDPSQSNFTMDEIMAMYPGYLEYIKLSLSQAEDIDLAQ